MNDHLNLEALLLALREAKLPVGVSEALRLQQVFAQQPDFASGNLEDNRRRLKALLRAVLVKNEKDRKAFDQICDIWLKRAEQDFQVYLRPEPPPSPFMKPAAVVAGPAIRRRPRRWLAAVVIAALAALAIGGYFLLPLISDHPEKPSVETPVKPPESVSSIPKPDLRKEFFTTAVPALTVTPPAVQWTGWWALGLSGLALVTAAGLWLTLGRRRWLPEFAPAPTHSGPPRVFLRSPPLPGPQLLDARQQEALVWGIGRFIADEPGPHLDLPATVAATARQGGIPALHYRRASYQREVWLWLDEAAEDSTLFRLADDIEATLQAHGLVAERATFRGIPERLTTPEGAVFAPHEIDERRDLALVAVLTDGRALARQYAVDDRRTHIDALLRNLSHWPRLAFVDFSTDRSPLAGMLAKHDLERIPPTGLAAFLGGDSAGIAALREWRQDDTAWAAVCALAPGSVDEAAALALWRRLRLGVSPWALRALRAEAAGSFGRLQWNPDRRAELLNWLLNAEAHPAGGVAPDSLLDRALGFWETRYGQERQQRLANDGVVPFKDTRAHRQMAMEHNLVLLWRRPQQAITALYQLFQQQPPLQAQIRQELGRLAPRGRGETGRIQLPWPWDQRSAVEQAMLQAMGFGGGLATVRLRRPGRLWLGLGICLGVALGEGWLAWRSPTVLPGGPPVIVHGAGKPADAWHEEPVELADDRWRVSVHARKSVEPAETEVVPAAQVQVHWEQQKRPCVEVLQDGAELWRCGLAEMAPLTDLRRNLVALVAPPRDFMVENLAIDLLTSGGADIVLIDAGWPRRQQLLLGPHERLGTGQQLLVFTIGKPAEAGRLLPPGDEATAVVSAGSWSRLAEALHFKGIRSVGELEPVVAVQGDENCRLRGLISISFVSITPGTFMMGSPANEKDRYSNEGPVHKVTLGEFWMGKYEVTNAQYRLFKKDWQGEDNLPVVNVSWNDAKAFCEYLGHRLPTEAEWEYAARAGTSTRYSFGDDESRLGDYAWFDGNSDNKSHPVGQKQPNPWGLYDMHGNVWEWVQDCYHDNYEGAPAEGSAWQTDNCEYRVLRGGSFDGRARDLRSAFRLRNQPEDRSWDFGFRCVRGSRRPP